jgi:hypothetical protein
MNGAVLVGIFVFLFFLPGVFSTVGVFCNSSDPSEIIVASSYFGESGDFSIKLKNLTSGSIEIVSVSHSGTFVIKEAPSGVIEGVDFAISGAYPLKEAVDEEISLTYIPGQGSEKEVIIRCAGTNPGVGWAEYATLVFSFFIGALLFFAFGAIGLFYGRKKRKAKIRVVGFLLLLLAAIAFLFFIMLFLSNP